MIVSEPEYDPAVTLCCGTSDPAIGTDGVKSPNVAEYVPVPLEPSPQRPPPGSESRYASLPPVPASDRGLNAPDASPEIASLIVVGKRQSIETLPDAVVGDDAVGSYVPKVTEAVENEQPTIAASATAGSAQNARPNVAIATARTFARRDRLLPRPSLGRRA